MKDDEIATTSGGSPFRAYSKLRWSHPDPRLAIFIYNCAVAGIPQSQIAKMCGCDQRDIKKHYSPELETGRDMAVAQLVGKAMDKALIDGDEKCLIFLLKSVGGINERTREKQAAEEADEKDSLKNKTALDVTKLDKHELKKFHEYLAKMQEDPNPIPGEVIRREES